MNIVDRILNKKTIGVGYLERWHLIPRNRFFNIYLHRFTGNDDDRALHDHPWDSFSVLVKGELREIFKSQQEHTLGIFFTSLFDVFETRRVKRFCYRPAEFAHRLELVGNKPAWTIFITGPRKREWGFHCSKGWQHWSTMTTEKGETIGGCE